MQDAEDHLEVAALRRDIEIENMLAGADIVCSNCLASPCKPGCHCTPCEDKSVEPLVIALDDASLPKHVNADGSCNWLAYRAAVVTATLNELIRADQKLGFIDEQWIRDRHAEQCLTAHAAP